MTFSLVMPLFKTEEFLIKAIDSLLDQDLTDWELIIVADGSSPKGEKIVKEYDDKRIRYITIKHGGACKARNEGAKLSTGKYLAFFSSDFQAIPGMLRTWVRSFEDHPEADFIYGGYMFPDRQCFPSEEFDARKLEAYNYIDGGFPLKRELWEKYPWDENVYSLNDWDFWLRIVKHGYKGYYLGNYYSYIAEYPRKDGLSYDSSKNWIERVKQIRTKNGVPMRDIVVCSVGGSYFAQKMAPILDADFMPNPAWKPHTYKMVYLLGFYATAADTQARMFLNAPKDCKKVIHFLGSDIMGLKKLSWENLHGLTKALNEKVDYMFAESEVKTKELKEMGFKAETLPLLRDISHLSWKPMPEHFVVAVYMPGINSDIYHPLLMENIAKNMPDVKFIFYGDKRLNDKPQVFDNMELVGWRPINEIIDKTSVLLRYTLHDGLPTAPMEFMMSGRFVISNADMPFIEKIEGCQDVEGTRKVLIEKIREVKRWIEKGKKPKREAMLYYKDYLDSQKIKGRINKLLK